MTATAPHRHTAPHHHRLLLRAAQRGDTLAAEQLLRHYEPLVRARVARLRLPRGIERDDVAQEARLGLWSAIRRWQPQRGPFPAFAERCVTNHALKAIDRAASQKHRLLTHAHPLDAAPDYAISARGFHVRRAQPAAALPAPDAVVVAREQLAALAAQLPTLGRRERDIVYGIIAGRSQAELASDYATTRKAVSSALARARTKLTRTAELNAA